MPEISPGASSLILNPKLSLLVDSGMRERARFLREQAEGYRKLAMEAAGLLRAQLETLAQRCEDIAVEIESKLDGDEGEEEPSQI